MIKNPRKPDYKLKAFDKKNGVGSKRIACGWINENGTIDIVIDLGCHLVYDDNISYRLFLYDEKEKE